MVLCEFFLVFQIDVYAVPVQFGFGNIITTNYNFESDVSNVYLLKTINLYFV